MASESPEPRPRRLLTLFDATCIIVGTIIGAGIYQTSPLVARNVSSPAWLLVAWVLGGLLSLAGALCYAELVAAYPHEGGDYVFTKRAFGRPLGFLFAWAQFWVVRPGSTGAVALVFAKYAHELLQLPGVPYPQVAYASAAIVVLTLVNVLGVAQGKWTQNVLTVAKVLGLLAIFGVALAGSRAAEPAAAGGAASPLGFTTLAMIMVLFTYGGWNDVALVGAEVRDPQRNALRSLVLGIGCVTAVYVLVNLAFLMALGFAGTRASGAVAADTMRTVLGETGARLISGLVCVSAFGAINGYLLTGARIYSAFGKDHALFAVLGRWSGRFGTPVWSLLAQAVVTLALVALFGTPLWSRVESWVIRQAPPALAAPISNADAGAPDAQPKGEAAPAEEQQDPDAAFRQMVIFTTPAFWFFILLVGLALFKLRDGEPHVERPFKVPWYPLLPFVFCLCSYFMFTSSLTYAYDHRSLEAFWSIGILALGLVLCWFSPRPRTERTGMERS